VLRGRDGEQHELKGERHLNGRRPRRRGWRTGWALRVSLVFSIALFELRSKAKSAEFWLNGCNAAVLGHKSAHKLAVPNSPLCYLEAISTLQTGGRESGPGQNAQVKSRLGLSHPADSAHYAVAWHPGPRQYRFAVAPLLGSMVTDPADWRLDVTVRLA
jgi:hypothetical protein